MIWTKLLLVLSPVLMFYIIYRRYFHFRPEYIKHLQAFATGMAAALLVIILAPAIASLLPSNDIFFKGFIKAGLVEKTAALIAIFLIQLRYPNFSIVEAVLSGIFFALGFSAIENVFFEIHFGLSGSILRIFFSVPMHLTTCGILGFFLGKMKMSDTLILKMKSLLTGFLIAWLGHSLFDVAVFSGGKNVFFIVPLLFILVGFLELNLSRAVIIPGQDVIKALEIRFDDWLMIWRQPKYERWISQSMDKESAIPISPFVWRPGAAGFLLFIIFLVMAVGGFYYKNIILYRFHLNLTSSTEILVFHVFPLSMALTTIVVGAVNPEFFKYSEIKIPVILDVVLDRGKETEETYITYDITASSCFLRTFESFGTGKILGFSLDLPGFKSIELTGEVVWESHDPGFSPSGSIVKILDPPLVFFLILQRYHLFRLRKGIIFFFKLPGFETIRKLFVHPVTTMQKERLVREGEIIFKEGDPSREFYLLKKGKIEIFKEREDEEIIQLNTIEDGQIFGELAVFSGLKRSASARALEDSILARADKNNLKALVRSNPEFALQLFQTLAERINQSEEVLMDNIQYLERQKIEKQRFIDSLSFFLLIVLGNRLDIHGKGIDLIDIKSVVEKVDDSIAMDLAKIVLMQRKDFESEEEFGVRVVEAFREFFENAEEQ